VNLQLFKAQKTKVGLLETPYTGFTNIWMRSAPHHAWGAAWVHTWVVVHGQQHCTRGEIIKTGWDGSSSRSVVIRMVRTESKDL